VQLIFCLVGLECGHGGGFLVGGSCAEAGDGLRGFARVDSPFSGLYRFGVNFRGDDCGFHDECCADAQIQHVLGHGNELSGDETDYDGPMDFLELWLTVGGKSFRQGESHDIASQGPEFAQQF